MILDESTVLTSMVTCVDNRFQLEVKLGSGRTTISTQAKVGNNPMVESGFYIFRDCSVTNIIGSSEVYINSDKRELDNLFVLEKNRTMVPLREVAGFFGATISWNAQKKACNVTVGRKTSSISIGSKTANVAGFTVESNPPAKIINGTLYVSSRLLSKTVSGGVAWDSYTRTITLAVP
ncbi:MAG: copper amine oxidase N-terminal domain-containing protein [Caldiserica bacterium]|nr:copper amine oxidase N-terminal domain-containing protein [Caldisericota bacterium]